MELLKYTVENCLILIPVLNVIGQIIKGIEKIDNRFIPLILLAFGVAGSIGILGFNAEAVIQGVLVTGTAVYGNQLVKQLKQ
ncbi:MAG: phage holin family protein [Clostridiaceae bacterium]|nr:phage holin family protein [Clostridiaceae bacterium]